MRRRSTVQGSSRAIPPFFGRQIRNGGRKLEGVRNFLLSTEHEVTVDQCPRTLRKILHKVFQGIHVAKSAVADSVAFAFNKAVQESNQALARLLSVGVEAVKCFAVNKRLQLVLKPFGSKEGITICDAPAAFVC